jgi:LysR substrate binding domain
MSVDGGPRRVPAGGSARAGPRSGLRINNGMFIREAALAGLGIALVPAFIVPDELRTGALRALDVGFEPEAPSSLSPTRGTGPPWRKSTPSRGICAIRSVIPPTGKSRSSDATSPLISLVQLRIAVWTCVTRDTRPGPDYSPGFKRALNCTTAAAVCTSSGTCTSADASRLSHDCRRSR